MRESLDGGGGTGGGQTIIEREGQNERDNMTDCLGSADPFTGGPVADLRIPTRSE